MTLHVLAVNFSSLKLKMHMRKLFTLLAAVVLLFGQLAAQSNRTVTGKVTDENGLPLAGVTVSAVGTSRKVLTDKTGNFAIQITGKVKAIQFSYVGFALQEVSVTDASTVNVTISLKAEDASLSEVVVVGYTTQKRKDLTANIATVKGQVVADRPVQSFDQALAGRATGVQISIPNGVLNAPPVFRIQGTNSLSLSSYPLIIVDGVPTPTGDYSSTNAAGNALASINPNDIESIDIAKDAAATAIYGSRAANGVVFITTKKGRSGAARVTYNGSVSWTQMYGLPEVMNAQQYTDFKNMAAANNQNLNTTNPSGGGYTKFALTTGLDGKPIDTKWSDVVYHNGISQNHNLNISGGSDATMYYFSVGYTNQQGMIKKNEFKRANMLFNLDSKLNKWLTVGGKLAFSNEKNLAASSSGSLPGEAFSTAGIGRGVLVNAPNVGVYNNDGSYNINANNIIGPMANTVAQVGFYNPQVLFDLNRSNSETQHLQSNVYVQVKPTKWLTLKSLYGVDYLFVDNDIFWNPIHGDGFAATGQAYDNFGKYKRWDWVNTAQLDHTFADRHTVSVLIGSEQDRRTSEGYGINRQQLSDPAYQVIQAGWGINNPTGMALGENYLLSTFGNLNYDFSKKYFLTANLRQDEYSAFAEKKEVFYGVGARWQVSQEKFWQTTGLSKIINSFNIKGSYGKVGNSLGIGDYPSFSTFGSGLYGGLPTLGFNQAGNPNLKWETSKKTDVGVSFSMLKNRLSVEANYYYNNVSDLILNVPQSPSTGVPNNIPTNVGAMFNKGIELQISGTPIQYKDFSWTSTLNITTNNNQVTSLAPGLNEILTATSSLETVSRTAVGYSAGYLWLVRNAGVDPGTGRRILLNKAGQPVLYQFAPAAGQFQWSNPDGTQYKENGVAVGITQAKDGVMVGNVNPKEFGGWDNTFRYKGLELNVLFTYQFDYFVYYGTNAGLHDMRYWNNAIDVLDAWKKPGDVTTVPRPVYNDNVSNGSGLPMSYNMFKGDFIKLKTMTLGYNIPKNILDKAKIRSARLYVSGQNLAIITKYPGPDPEVSANGNGNLSQGIDRNTVPNSRNYVIGVNVGF
jgi:TonB-dependent starch-binding outer membrane protein SusC